MISKASATYVRIAPRKVRYVIDLIRSKPVSEAQAILSGSPRRASGIVRKLLNQALDAAGKNSQVQPAQLVVSKVLADGGPSMRRFRAASMGRASIIRKRTSHITLELDLAKRSVAAPAPSKPAQARQPKPKAEPKAPAGRKPAAKKMAGAK
jgi:large subunit ribosomal protein L22